MQEIRAQASARGSGASPFLGAAEQPQQLPPRPRASGERGAAAFPLLLCPLGLTTIPSGAGGAPSAVKAFKALYLLSKQKKNSLAF